MCDMDRYELAVILKDVGNFSMDDFAGRLTLQKTVCLLQAFGVDLKYRFGWYLHGPYCKALFKDGQGARRVFDALPEVNVSFDEEETQRRYEQFKEFMEDKKHDPALLEIGASICHLVAKGFDKGVVLGAVEDKKPEFSRGQCVSMWDELERYGVVCDGAS